MADSASTPGEATSPTPSRGRRRQPERRDPPVGWVRLRFTKLGPARFMSARDVGRLMERALKRAQVPVAYSSGFNPHQRVSYAYPAPTGAASRAEYALVALAGDIDAGDLAARLGSQLPDGVRVAATRTDERHLPPLLEASVWHLTWRLDPPDAGALAAAVERFLAAPQVVVERRSKSGVAAQDVRAAVVSLRLASPGPDDSGLVVVSRQAEPLIRPGDVLDGLRQFCPIPTAPLLERSAHGTLTPEGRVLDLP